MTTHKANYPEDKKFKGPLISLALSDIHARLKHFDQFLRKDFQFTGDQKQDIVKFTQGIRENLDNYAEVFTRSSNNLVGLDLNGNQHSIGNLINEVTNDIVINCQKIIKFYTK